MKQTSSPAWSIPDVPLQAREQVSVAASRDGLSVGDWLARNILSETHNSGSENAMATPRPQSIPAVSSAVPHASEPSPSSNRLRVEEALQALAHVLESHERAQQHASEAMQSVASEVAAATREQEAVLQNLGARVEKVEHSSGEIEQRSRETAERLTSLAGDLEALGIKIVSARDASDRFSLFVQEQLSVFAERVRATESRGANIARFDADIARLRDVHAGLAGNLDQLAARFDRLVSDVHAAREVSDRVSTVIQDKIAGLDGRLQNAEAHGAKISDLDRAVSMLGEGHALVASQVAELAADLARVDEQIALTKTESGDLAAGIRKEIAALSSRIAVAEEKVAAQADIERTIAALNTQDNAIASKLGALSANVTKLQDDLQSVREAAAHMAREQESMAAAIARDDGRFTGFDERLSGLEDGIGSMQTGAVTLQQAIAALEARMQAGGAHPATHAEIEATLSNLAANHKEVAAQARTTAADVERLHDELQATRDVSNRVAAVIQDKLSAFAGHLDASSERSSVLAQIENVAAALRDRMNALEENAGSAAERNAASIGQSREAIGILIERSEAQSAEVHEIRENLSRIERRLAQLQQSDLREMSIDPAGVAGQPIQQGAEAPEFEGELVGETSELPPPVVDIDARPDEAVFADVSSETEAAYAFHAMDVPHSGDDKQTEHYGTESGNGPANLPVAGDSSHVDGNSPTSAAAADEMPPHREDGSADALMPVRAEHEMDIPAHEESAPDILAELESEAPAAEPGAETATPELPPAASEAIVDGDYLSEARRIAREAHEQSTREGSLKGDWARSIADETQSRYLRPALAVALIFAVGALAFWFARSAPSNTPSPANRAVVAHAPRPNLAQAGQRRARVQPVSSANAAPKALPPQSAPPALSGSDAAAAPNAAPATLDQVRGLAQRGDSKAMLTLGLAYDKGAGVPVDQIQATAWLERAAEAGDPVAQFRLAVRLEKGVGAPKDPAQAVHWYRKAAVQGNRSAMYNLGVASANGAGTAKDLREAARWFQAAAALGLTDSQFNLAVLYEHGWGLEQSLINAYQWYSIAALNGDAQSREHSEALATQITPAEKASADRAVAGFKAGIPKPDANDLPPILKSLAP